MIGSRFHVRLADLARALGIDPALLLGDAPAAE
jgi:ABC-type transporter Mla maintaining outer membrane lipid asymmetry ATPase subunit MlaF